jgi:hypothetical protein
MKDLKAYNESLVDALDHISRVSRAGRTKSRRNLWISARADSAINGDDNWRDLNIPRSSSPTQAVRIKMLEQKLVEVANELCFMINKENERIKSGISSTDLDGPDYLDHQTVHEAMVLAKGNKE